jgi:hypothetical protein
MFTSNNTTNYGSSSILHASKSLYNALNISFKALNCQKFKKEVKKYFPIKHEFWRIDIALCLHTSSLLTLISLSWKELLNSHELLLLLLLLLFTYHIYISHNLWNYVKQMRIPPIIHGAKLFQASNKQTNNLKNGSGTVDECNKFKK